jgi:uncharacterized membrane-anchored protein YhcB (DUF1043 family)
MTLTPDYKKIYDHLNKNNQDTVRVQDNTNRGEVYEVTITKRPTRN